MRSKRIVKVEKLGLFQFSDRACIPEAMARHYPNNSSIKDGKHSYKKGDIFESASQAAKPIRNAIEIRNQDIVIERSHIRETMA